MACHVVSLLKVQSFVISTDGSYEHMPNSFALNIRLVSDHMCASCAHTRVSPSHSVFHDFLLVLTDGCKFLEGCVCVCVNVLFLTSCGQLGVFSPLEPEPSPGRRLGFIIELVLKYSLAGPLYRRLLEPR